MEIKEKYTLGDRHYNRYLKGPCMVIDSSTTTTADGGDIIDTRGIKNRKGHTVIRYC